MHLSWLQLPQRQQQQLLFILCFRLPLSPCVHLAAAPRNVLLWAVSCLLIPSLPSAHPRAHEGRP